MSEETIRTIIVSLAALGQTLFVFRYLALPWWETFLGRALFTKGVAFMILLSAGAAGRVWDWPGEERFIIAFYGLATIGIWFQLIAFIRQGRQHSGEETVHEQDQTKT